MIRRSEPSLSVVYKSKSILLGYSFSGTHVAVGSGRVSLRSRKPVVVWCGFHALLVSFRLGTRQAAARHACQTGATANR